VQRYPERTGHPGDEIVSFDAWQIEHRSPPPGQSHPTDVRRRRFLRWAAAGGAVAP
jgi:hypothetical protein